MSKIHYFQRYASVENTVTNNTLQLIARIYDYSISQASKLLTEITGEPIEIGIEINQQQRLREAVPDGTIIQRSFKVLVESKVDSGVDVGQLVRHASNFTTESQKVLILLTKQKIGLEMKKEIQEKIYANQPDIIFKNVTYEEICTAISGLFKDYEIEMRSLVDDYVEYCNDVNLFDQSRYLMRIVPCGDSFELNMKYGIYYHPSDRGYTNHLFIGIYANKIVRCIWAIDSIFDVEFDGSNLQKNLVHGRDTNEYDQKIIDMIEDAKTECGHEVESDHRFFCGKEVHLTNFRKTSFGGMQGTRFVNLKNLIGEFSDVKEVAHMLDGKEWE